MKILWVSHFLPYPPSGGVLQRGYGLVRGLSRFHGIHLLALNQPRLIAQTLPGVSDPVEHATRQLRVFCRSVQVAKIPSESWKWGRGAAAVRGLLFGTSYTQEWLRSREFERIFDKQVNSHRPDIINLDTISFAPLFDSLVGKSVPVVMDHHNVESQMMSRRAEFASGLTRRYLSTEAARIRELEQQYCPRMALNIMCSELDADRLIKLAPGSPTFVVPNGVGAPEWQPSDAPEDELMDAATSRTFVFVGRMSAYTNASAVERLALQIWPRIRRRIQGAKLLVIGSEPPKSLRDLAATDENVTVLGFVDRLEQVIRPGMIFLCPITDGGGTKLKVLDALNRGLPLIADAIAMEGIAARDGLEYLSAGSDDSYCDQAVRLIENNALRRELMKRGFKLIQDRYSFDSISTALATKLQGLTR